MRSCGMRMSTSYALRTGRPYRSAARSVLMLFRLRVEPRDLADEDIAPASRNSWPAVTRVRLVTRSTLNLYLTLGTLSADHKTVRRLLGSLCATVCTAFVTLAAAPTGGAVGAP